VIDPKIETVKRVYSAFASGDVAAILTELNEDVVWQVDADPSGVPWYGVHSGKAQVAKFFLAVSTSARVTRFEPLSFACNESEVFAVLECEVEMSATGKHGRMLLHHWWGFRGGRVDRFHGSEDSALTAQLLTP